MPPALAGALVMATSGAVLVIEILAARLLAPYVGTTLQTYTAIIGTILAGISAGTWLGGRIADRRDPRDLLGVTLLSSGALTLVTVPVVDLIGPAFTGAGPVASVLLSLVAFLLPAAVLSAVSPMVVKLQLQTLEETGRVVGQLSALGTAGALLGTFVTGFLLVATLPSSPILLALGALLVAAGLALHVTLRAAPGQPLVALVVLGLAGGGLTVARPRPCEVESAYFCAQVLEDLAPCDGLTLYLDTLRHSCVYPDDPTRLDFSYAQIMSDVLAAIAPGGQALDVLHIGGGGFTLPRYIATTRPGSTNVVYELDPALVQIAEDQLGLETGPDLRVEVGDARVQLQQRETASADVVIGDAFGGLAVPWHLTTREFTEEIERVLRPDGVYAINLIDRPPLGFARAETATLAAVFDHVAVIAPPDRLRGLDGGNFVLVASNAPLPVDAIDARNAARGDDDEVLVDTGAFTGNTGGTDGAQVLTDEFAPVDQLLTPR